MPASATLTWAGCRLAQAHAGLSRAAVLPGRSGALWALLPHSAEVPPQQLLHGGPCVMLAGRDRAPQLLEACVLSSRGHTHVSEAARGQAIQKTRPRVRT